MSGPMSYAFFGGLLAYLAGAISSLIAWREPKWARLLCCRFALAGAVLEIIACCLSLLGNTGAHWEIRSGVPFLIYGFSLDALSTYFNLVLSFLAAAVSVYSLDYLRPFEENKTIGVFGLFYNLLLFSLTLVFTASNAFFFLIAWEAMALAAYCLVSFEHWRGGNPKTGVLFFCSRPARTQRVCVCVVTLNL